LLPNKKLRETQSDGKEWNSTLQVK